MCVGVGVGGGSGYECVYVGGWEQLMGTGTDQIPVTLGYGDVCVCVCVGVCGSR